MQFEFESAKSKFIADMTGLSLVEEKHEDGSSIFLEAESLLVTLQKNREIRDSLADIGALGPGHVNNIRRIECWERLIEPNVAGNPWLCLLVRSVAEHAEAKFWLDEQQQFGQQGWFEKRKTAAADARSFARAAEIQVCDKLLQTFEQVFVKGPLEPLATLLAETFLRRNHGLLGALHVDGPVTLHGLDAKVQAKTARGVQMSLEVPCVRLQHVRGGSEALLKAWQRRLRHLTIETLLDDPTTGVFQDVTEHPVFARSKQLLREKRENESKKQAEFMRLWMAASSVSSSASSLPCAKRRRQSESEEPRGPPRKLRLSAGEAAGGQRRFLVATDNGASCEG